MNKPYENKMPSGVDSFVEEASKEEVKAPEKPMQPKSDWKQTKMASGVLHEQGKNRIVEESTPDFKNKQYRVGGTQGKIYNSLDEAKNSFNQEQPKQESDYEVFAKALKGGPYKADLALEEAGFARPVGYNIAHDPKSKTYSFFNESGDEIRNPERKQNQELSNLYHLRKRYLPVIEGVDESEMDINEANKIYDRWDDEKSLEEYFAKNPKSEDVSDEELKEELVDNKYYYENARSEEEIAKWLAERQDIPYDRALAFVKANYKNGAIWSEGKTYEPFDKYEDDIRAKAKEVSDSMKSIGYYNLSNKDELEQAYQDLAYDLKEQFPMVDPKEIEKYVAEEGINLY